MRNLVIFLVVALLVLHQDFWWWDDSDTLVLGFIPITMAWHVGISVAASLCWAMAMHYCWPAGLDEADEPAAPAGPHKTGGAH